MTTRRAIVVIAVIGLMALLIFGLAPLLDRPLSRLFFRPGEGFWLRNTWPLLGVYYGTRVMTTMVALGLLGTLIWAWSSKQEAQRRWRIPAAFALASLALGPWLLAHAIKDHGGRARPAHIVDFGGTERYTPPWQAADNCAHNCSFPSAHAIAGFWFITGAWVLPNQRRRWWLIGIGMGAAIGLVRIIQGGHFLSDVLGAFGLMWASNAALAALFRWRRWPPALHGNPAAD